MTTEPKPEVSMVQIAAGIFISIIAIMSIMSPSPHQGESDTNKQRRWDREDAAVEQELYRMKVEREVERINNIQGI